MYKLYETLRDDKKVRDIDVARATGIPPTTIYDWGRRAETNPNAALSVIAGCFQTGEAKGKIQHGSAWWFNDTKIGMESHLQTMASVCALGSFVGMLTDSRSFLSYTRHEYFRRILCNLVGQWVEDGEYPNDEEALKTIIEGVCYNNAVRFLGLEGKL